MSKLQILLGTAALAILLNGCASTGTQDSTSGRLQEPETPVRDLVIPPCRDWARRLLLRATPAD